jgi:hypothetical protein
LAAADQARRSLEIRLSLPYLTETFQLYTERDRLELPGQKMIAGPKFLTP